MALKSVCFFFLSGFITLSYYNLFFKDGIKCLEYPFPSSIDLSFWDFPPIFSPIKWTDSQDAHLARPWVALPFPRKGAGRASTLSPGMTENAWTLCLRLDASLTGHRVPQNSELDGSAPQSETPCLLYLELLLQVTGSLVVISL